MIDRALIKDLDAMMERWPSPDDVIFVQRAHYVAAAEAMRDEGKAIVRLESIHRRGFTNLNYRGRWIVDTGDSDCTPMPLIELLRCEARPVGPVDTPDIYAPPPSRVYTSQRIVLSVLLVALGLFLYLCSA